MRLISYPGQGVRLISYPGLEVGLIPSIDIPTLNLYNSPVGFLLSLFLGVSTALAYAAIVYWLDRYEKEPRRLLAGVFLWGAFVAGGGALLINSLLGAGIYAFTGSLAASELATSTLIAPLVEETLKGLAVLGVFLRYRSEFDSLLDGIVYAAVTALGFAAAENTLYIYRNGYLQNGFSGLFLLAFVRVVLVGWQHPFYTAFTGAGLSAARYSRSAAIRLGAPLIGWSLAVSAHALHNALAGLLPGLSGLMLGTALDWSGWLFMLGVIFYATARERRWLREYLAGEVQRGALTADQYRTACSAWSQSAARLSALFRGRYRVAWRFYQLCGELAHKKRQLARMGDEGGNAAEIERLRAELASLSPLVGR